jgi:diaminopimelate epimerase
MKMDYYVLDPTGNITILVRTPVPEAEQPAVAAGLMAAEPSAEQVGFLSSGEDCDLALRMAGGEFCGNASMSAAMLRAMSLQTESCRVRLRVSGAEKPVTVQMTAGPDGIWTGTVKMPDPMSVETVDLPEAGPLPLVRFEGISHVIMEKEVSRPEAERFARDWCACLGADALGLMFLDRAACRLVPLVYVPAAGTLYWENSCASGTTAVGAYLAAKAKKPVKAFLAQPGGSLTVQVQEDGGILLTGTVRLLKHKCQ